MEYAGSSKNLKIKLNPTFGYVFQRIKVKYLYPHVHCSIINNSQTVEKLKCLSTDEWMI